LPLQRHILISGPNSQNLKRVKERGSIHRQQIINGEVEEDIANYPYTVSLLKRNQVKNEKNGRYQIYHSCGGVLIAPDIVLSAGHCFNYTDVVHANTAIADHDKRFLQGNNSTRINIIGTDSVKKGRWNQAFGIKDEWKIIHPLYNELSMTHDLMIIRLPKPVEDATPIHLNKYDTIPIPEDDIKILGWGLTDQYDQFSVSEELLRADLFYVNNEVCQLFYDDYNHVITNDMLCGYSGDGQDSCQGDSGGPMVVKRSEDPTDHELVGIVSWGIGCGLGVPGVYSRISSSYEWIKEQVCLLSTESCDEKKNIIDFNECQEDYLKYFKTKGGNTRKNCEWVARKKDVRCIRHKGKCPITCNDPKCSFR
jgi:trypsin